MRVAREVETKLAVDDAFVLPDLAAVKGVESVAMRSHRLRATYYDTEDLRLARSGTTLRHRTGEGRPCWTLKLASTAAEGLDRVELTIDGPGTAVPEALQELLTARLRGAVLQRAVQLRTARTTRVLAGPEGPLLEVVDDRVAVVEGTAVVRRWRELEVEVEDRAAPSKLRARVVELLVSEGAKVGDQTPKALRALGSRATGPADLPSPGRVRRKDPAAALVRWSLADGLARLVEHDLGVRRGLEDAVHQLRVSCRRLRSDLRTFRELLDDPRTGALREELAWLADSFGGARDLEVLRARLERTARADPLCPLDEGDVDALLAGQEQYALDAARAALRSPRYLALLQLLHDTAVAPGLTAEAERPCREVLPEIVERTWAHLRKRARVLGVEDPDADWHRARILAKRARYAAESARIALGDDMRPQVKASKAVQEVLGEHQDAAVAADRVLALAGEHPDQHTLAVTCGRLAERERAQVVALRRKFLAAGLV